MVNTTLKIAQIANRGNKFAIMAGKAVLGKFKTVELAKSDLAENKEMWEFWANSASTSIQNTPAVIRWV